MSKTKKRKYRPRTEAQKKARRERDRRRREAERCAKNAQSRHEKKAVNVPKAKVAEKHQVVKAQTKGIAVLAAPIKKRLVEVTVIKKYVID